MYKSRNATVQKKGVGIMKEGDNVYLNIKF